MDSTDAYLVARCLLLADAHRGLDDLPPEARIVTLAAADILDLLAKVLTEAGDHADSGG